MKSILNSLESFEKFQFAISSFSLGWWCFFTSLMHITGLCFNIRNKQFLQNPENDQWQPSPNLSPFSLTPKIKWFVCLVLWALSFNLYSPSTLCINTVQMFVSVFPLRIHNLNNYSLSVEISNERNVNFKVWCCFFVHWTSGYFRSVVI